MRLSAANIKLEKLKTLQDRAKALDLEYNELLKIIRLASEAARKIQKERDDAWDKSINMRCEIDQILTIMKLNK